MTRWFEDLEPGSVYALGQHTFSAEEIERFARRYDPQYLHLDADAAAAGPFGGLVASGWHTACVGHRLMVDTLFADDEAQRARGEEPGVPGPSPGVNKAEFRAPVRPGDTVSYELALTDKRVSGSLRGWGLLFNDIVGTNQHGEVVYRAELVSFTKLRDYRMPLRARLLLALTRIPGLRKLARR